MSDTAPCSPRCLRSIRILIGALDRYLHLPPETPRAEVDVAWAVVADAAKRLATSRPPYARTRSKTLAQVFADEERQR